MANTEDTPVPEWMVENVENEEIGGRQVVGNWRCFEGGEVGCKERQRRLEL